MMLSSKNVFDDDLHYEDPRYLSESAYALEHRRTEVKSGDVLLTIVGTVGRAAVVPENAPKITLQRSVAVIKPDREQIDARFLMYALIEKSTELNESARGVAQKGIYLESLRRFAIRHPPLPEQRRIVGILDEAFAAIATAKANAEKNLQNARDVFASELAAVFSKPGEGWIDSKIGQHIRFIDYRGKTPEKTDSGLRLITAKNVKMGFVQDEPLEYVDPAIYDSWMTRGIPRNGDVLFTTEAPLANVAQLETDEKVVFAQRIIVMHPDRAKLDPTFVKYLLLSAPIQQRIRAQGTGATVQGIKASLLKLVPISFPSTLKRQRELAERFDSFGRECRRLGAVARQKLAALDALKKSLLHQAFSGQFSGDRHAALESVPA